MTSHLARRGTSRLRALLLASTMLAIPAASAEAAIDVLCDKRFSVVDGADTAEQIDVSATFAARGEDRGGDRREHDSQGDASRSEHCDLRAPGDDTNSHAHVNSTNADLPAQGVTGR